MIRPVENHERLHPTEYVNRVKQTDPADPSSAREFSYEIEELNREGKKHHEKDREFGEDTYEPTEQEKTAESQNENETHPPQRDNGTLDVTV